MERTKCPRRDPRDTIHTKHQTGLDDSWLGKKRENTYVTSTTVLQVRYNTENKNGVPERK